MGTYYQILSTLLTSSPGNLTYHLVIGFSLAWALQTAIVRYHSRQSERARHVILGFSILLSVRLIVFLIAAITAQTQARIDILPPLDRGVTILGLLIITWLWAFPEPTRKSDVLTIILVCLDLVFLAINFIVWNNHSPEITFNSSLLSPLWELIAIVVCTAGFLLLFLRHPKNWGIGIFIYIINLIGHSIAFFSPIFNSDYPAAVRLAQIITYPLFFTLIQDIQNHVHSKEDVQEMKSQEQASNVSYPDLNTLLEQWSTFLGSNNRSDQQGLLNLLCGLFKCDYIIFIQPPRIKDAYALAHAFSSQKTASFDLVDLTSKQIPLIYNSLQRVKPISLRADNKSQDMATLQKYINQRKDFHILASPLISPDIELIGLILIREHPQW